MRRLIFATMTLFAVTLSAEAGYETIPDECTLKILSPGLADVKRAKIRLDNGLEALLISDPGVHQSCAGLAVDAGSWQDSDEYPGIAHFLEHMLFMGTKAYPQEAEYKQFISDHGGSMNAYTASNRTVYGFSINNDFLSGALNRFAHFFIDPLFLQNCVGRELQAVDQEHAKNIEHDGWRAFMILKEIGNPNHPNAKFSTGNRETLSGIPREALQKWYEEHYSAERMHLVVISPFSIDEMTKMVTADFGPVVKRNLEAPSYPYAIFSEKQVGKLLYIQPVKDYKTLELVWQLPLNIALDQETHATNLVAYALGNEAENSLCENLKREKLIEGLAVAVTRLSRECAILSLDFSLTEQGVLSIETIAKRAFQTIRGLAQTGIPEYIFKERQTLALMEYEYQSRQDAFSQALDIAGEMTEEALATYPQKQTLATRFDPTLVQTLLQSLTPEKCTYLVIADSKLTGITPSLREKWMDASYDLKSVPSEQLALWSASSPHPQIGLPAPNLYFPESLELVQRENATEKTPISIANDELGSLYFLQDQTYLVPETAALISLKTPEMDGSAKSKALFDLYSRALSEKLRFTLFFAHEAGLSLALSQSYTSFDISVSGYSDKAPLLLKTVFTSLAEVSPTAAEFEIYKKSLLSDYDNASKELPLKQAAQTLNTVLLNDSPSSEALLESANQISYEQFLSFCYQVFQTTYLEGTVYGNLTALDAAQIWTDYQVAIHPTPFPKSQHHQRAVLLSPDAQGPFMIEHTTERQGNAALLLLYESPFSMENRAVQQILSEALEGDFYDTLRTKQQTGYIVSSWNKEMEKQLFQVFGVQSITHQPTDLLFRFELFLEEFARDIEEKIPAERFETLKQTLIKDLTKPQESLAQKASMLHHFAFEREGDFNWIEKRVKTTSALSYQQFLTIADTFLSRQNRHRVAILIEGVLPQKNLFRYEPISTEQIRSIGTYVSAKSSGSGPSGVVIAE